MWKNGYTSDLKLIGHTQQLLHALYELIKTEKVHTDKYLINANNLDLVLVIISFLQPIILLNGNLLNALMKIFSKK